MITENFKGVIRSSLLVPGYPFPASWVFAEHQKRETRNESRASNFLLGRKFACFVLEHHRDVVLDRIGEAARLADELGRGFLVQKRTLAQRAHQYVEQLAVHLKPVTGEERRVMSADHFRKAPSLPSTSSPSAGSG